MLHGFLFSNIGDKQNVIKDPSSLEKGHFPSPVFLWYRHAMDALSHW